MYEYFACTGFLFLPGVTYSKKVIGYASNCSTYLQLLTVTSGSSRGPKKSHSLKFIRTAQPTGRHKITTATLDFEPQISAQSKQPANTATHLQRPTPSNQEKLTDIGTNPAATNSHSNVELQPMPRYVIGHT